MLNVGLTGGIGSGKSEVTRRFAARGAMVIDADALAREVVAVGTFGLAQVVAEFGDDVLTPDGALDREKLGSVVFADDAARARLTGILHPLIGARAAELTARAETADADAIVINDVPLIAEAGLAGRYSVVVVVDAPVEVQLDRLVRLRGMTREAAQARIDVQATREQRRAIADHVIDNSAGLEALEAQVATVWAALQRTAEESVPGT